MIPDQGLLGVSGPDKPSNDVGGVLIRKFGSWPYLRPPKVAKLAVANGTVNEVYRIAALEIGKPFDNGALWDFLSDAPGDRNWRSTDSWFCSEFIAWVLETAGFFPYSLISAKNRITPADLLLLLNPFMSEENIREFS